MAKINQNWKWIWAKLIVQEDLSVFNIKWYLKKKGNNYEKKNNALKLLQGFVRQNQTAFNV